MDFIERAIRSHLTPEMTAFDVGANIGDYSAIMASVCRTVVAFEPIPEMASRIARHGLSNIELHPCAVSDTCGQATFYVDRRPETHAMQSSFLYIDELHAKAQAEAIIVPTTTIDAFVEETGQTPDFIKVDVEGWEPAVLQGARRVIATRRPPIIFEMWESYYPKYRDMILELFDDYFIVRLSDGADALAYYEAEARFDMEDMLCIPRPRVNRDADFRGAYAKTFQQAGPRTADLAVAGPRGRHVRSPSITRFEAN